MKKVFFTLTGANHYYGNEFIEPGMKIKLYKEPDNQYDPEAIRVEIKGLGKIGYVANSYRTPTKGSLSAGRLYDKIGKKAKAKVVYRIPNGALCMIKVDDSVKE